MGSGTGPRDFKVQYSADGSTFTDASGANSSYMVTNDAWVSTSVKSASIRTIDLSSVSTIDNQPTVYVRLVDNSTTNINAGTVATSGSDRVDSVTVTANALLPIELASFTGIARGNAVELSWKTATEVNNYGFDIQRTPLSPLEEGGTKGGWRRSVSLAETGRATSPIAIRLSTTAVYIWYIQLSSQANRPRWKIRVQQNVDATVAMAPNTMMSGTELPKPLQPGDEHRIRRTGYRLHHVKDL